MQNKLHAAVGPTARQEIHHTPARQVVRLRISANVISDFG